MAARKRLPENNKQLELAWDAIRRVAEQTLADMQVRNKAEKLLSTVPFGVPFLCRGKKVCKVKPTGYLLNSSVVTDSAAKGKFLLLNLETYTVFYSDAKDYERML